MTNAYRDDLEAALARASDLEREVEALRNDLRQRSETDIVRELDRVRTQLATSEQRVVETQRRWNLTVALVYLGVFSVVSIQAAGGDTLGYVSLALFGLITAIAVSVAGAVSGERSRQTR